MTPADLAELRAQAEARAAVGCRTSQLILSLLDLLAGKDAELAACDKLILALSDRVDVNDALIRGLSARVEVQSQLLSKRAEK